MQNGILWHIFASFLISILLNFSTNLFRATPVNMSIRSNSIRHWNFFFTIKKSKFRKYSWQLNFSLNDSNAFIIKVFWRFQFFFLFLRFSWFCIYITLFFSGGGVMDAFGEHDCKFFLCFTFLWFKKPQQNMYRTGSVNSNLNRGYSDIHTLYNRWTILIDSPWHTC